jgi:hypothetical protein
MKHNIVSILLFSLFCVVIVFPGYGKTAARCSNTQLNSPSEVIFTEIFLCCLSSGINMVGEERLHDQGDNTQAYILRSCCKNELLVLTSFRCWCTKMSLCFWKQPEESGIFFPPDANI